jgi:hypothetical protein
MTGSVKLRQADGGKACVVFGDVMPSWLPCLGELGLRAVLVFLKTDEHLDAVEALVDDECMILSGQDWRVFGSRLPTFESRQVIGLIDGRLTTDIALLARTMQMHSLSSTMAARRPVAGWAGHKVRVEHTLVGGVTACHPRIHRYDNRDVEYKVLAIPQSAPRDVGTVLSAVASSFHFRAAPDDHAVVPLAVVNLGNSSHPVYHGGGLLPGLIDRRTRVLTPGVYAPKGKWVIRCLTYVELLLSKDVSETLAKTLVTCQPLPDIVLSKLLPGKCLVSGFRALFDDWNGGGGEFRTGCGSEAACLKRKVEEFTDDLSSLNISPIRRVKKGNVEM